MATTEEEVVEEVEDPSEQHLLSVKHYNNDINCLISCFK